MARLEAATLWPKAFHDGEEYFQLIAAWCSAPETPDEPMLCEDWKGSGGFGRMADWKHILDTIQSLARDFETCVQSAHSNPGPEVSR